MRILAYIPPYIYGSGVEMTNEELWDVVRWILIVATTFALIGYIAVMMASERSWKKWNGKTRR